MLSRDQIRALLESNPEALIDLVLSLMAQVETLTRRVEELENQLALNSTNSSKPPSSDEHRPTPKSLRSKSDRKRGGQPGHKGNRLNMVAVPDEVHLHQVNHCRDCGVSLTEADHQVHKRRQVIELPQIRARVIEHQTSVCLCPGCGSVNQSCFPESIPAPISYGPRLSGAVLYLTQYQLLPYQRTQELIKTLLGISVSTGTLVRMVERGSEALKELVTSMAHGLRGQQVVHFDETGFYVEKKRQWLHVASTESLSYYMHHRRRGVDAMKAMNVLPSFSGTAVHDGHTPYWKYTQCRHSLCNVHHLRSLCFVEERYQAGWATSMKRLLLWMKQHVERCKARGDPGIDLQIKHRLIMLYDQIVARGLRTHPEPARKAETKRGPIKQGKARNLVLNLQRYRTEVLRFLTDFRVPFDNNQAERDIRMMKVKQKVSGAFRSQTGAEAFCRIRSYVSTMRKQGHNELDVLTSIFTNNLIMPLLGPE